MKIIFYIILLYFVGSCGKSITPHRVTSCGTIVEIGGCDRYACGVKLDTGEFVERSRPVVGQRTCVDHVVSTAFKWKWLWVN